MNWNYGEIFIFFTIVLLPPLYYLLRWMNNYYKYTDVKYIEPPFPFLASAIRETLGLRHFNDYIKDSYFKYPNERLETWNLI